MCIRKIFCAVIGLLWCVAGYAQQYAYQISFTDKKGSPSVSTPSLFLSPRALSRRAAQGIAVDSTDVPVSSLYVDSVLTTTNGILHLTSKWLNMCVILVSDTTNMHILRSKSYITGIKQVAYYPTFLHHRTANTQQTSGTTQSLVAKTTGTSWFYGQTYTQTILVNGDYLHDNGYQGQGKLIAVLDAGFIDADVHPGLDSLRSAGGYVDVHNFTLDTSFVFGYDTHGLSSLSTMAGYMPGGIGSDTGYVGSAPLAQYALYITEDDNSEQPIELDNLIAGTERADSIGADVVSVSLGYDTFDDPIYNFNFSTDFDGKTTVAAKAANFATSKGILFVASAGNEGVGVPGWGRYILTPGDADSAITVGAVDINGSNPNFSGYGPNAAGQVKPDVCLLGVSTAVFSNGGVIIKEDGTSFATPQLAGWAACLWQAAGAGTPPAAIRKAIDQSADHYNNVGPQIGYGVPDFQKAFQDLGLMDTPNTSATSPLWVVAEGNPFSNSLRLAVKMQAKGEVSFVLTDITGKKVFTGSQTFFPGWNPPVSLPIASSLPSGIYILRAIAATQQQIIKLVKD